LNVDDTLGLGVREGLAVSCLDTVVAALEMDLGAGVGSLAGGRLDGFSEWDDGMANRLVGPEAKRPLSCLSGNELDDRLLCMTGMDWPDWAWRSTVPSRLGRTGGVGCAEAVVFAAWTSRGWEYVVAVDGSDAACGRGASWDGLGTDMAPSRLSLGFWDDFRGGGLCGRWVKALAFFSVVSLARTVELEDDEVDSSLTAVKPWWSAVTELTSFETLPVLLRVTGGRVRAGSACRTLVPGGWMRIGATSPGECEDMEVGVVSRLYGPGPGDSDHLVEGLPLKALSWLLVPENSGVGGGRSFVAIREGRLGPGLSGRAGGLMSRYLSNSGYIVTVWAFVNGISTCCATLISIGLWVNSRSR
jgi:hypothetical protein